MKPADTAVSQFDVFTQLRFPLILLVVYAHTYSGVDPAYSLPLSGWNTYECLKILVGQTLAKVAVPAFYAMSGYLFFCGISQWSRHAYWQKLRRRCRSLLLPYLLWNALLALRYRQFTWHVFWDFYPAAGAQTDWLGHEQLLVAPLNMPLWFLRDLMVVSLLSPLFYWVLRRAGLWLLGLLTVAYLSGVCAFVPGLSAYAVYFFACGAYFGIRKTDVVSLMRRVELPAYALSALLAVLMLFTYHAPYFSSLMLAFRLTGMVALFCLASRVLAATPRRLPAVVSSSAYFIYLCHFVFFLAVIDRLLLSLLGSSAPALCLHYLLSPPLKVAVYLAVYVLWHRLRAFVSKSRFRF